MVGTHRIIHPPKDASWSIKLCPYSTYTCQQEKPAERRRDQRIQKLGGRFKDVPTGLCIWQCLWNKSGNQNVSAHFGRIPQLATTFWGDQPGGRVAINCLWLMFGVVFFKIFENHPNLMNRHFVCNTSTEILILYKQDKSTQVLLEAVHLDSNKIGEQIRAAKAEVLLDQGAGEGRRCNYPAVTSAAGRAIRLAKPFARSCRPGTFGGSQLPIDIHGGDYGAPYKWPKMLGNWCYFTPLSGVRTLLITTPAGAHLVGYPVDVSNKLIWGVWWHHIKCKLKKTKHRSVDI